MRGDRHFTVHTKLGGLVVCQMVVLSFRGTLAGWRNGLTNAKPCAWGGMSCEEGQAGAGEQLWGKILSILMDDELSMRQQCDQREQGHGSPGLSAGHRRCSCLPVHTGEAHLEGWGQHWLPSTAEPWPCWSESWEGALRQ